MRGSRRLLAALLIASAAATAASCSIRQRMHAAAERVNAPRDLSVCVLVVDGFSQEAFERLLAKGVLPNLKAELVDRGLSYQTTVSSVPSETYPNLGALETGLLPGHHGIAANIWLDRRLQMREQHTNIFRVYSAASSLSPDARTLFERLPADSVVVTTPLARGCTVHARNTAAVTASWLRNDWNFLDRKTLDDVGDAYAGALAAGHLPSVAWGHLLGPDEVAHFDGLDSPEFDSILANFDRAFARLVRRLKRWKVYDRILFVVTGDHGHALYSRYVPVDELVHRALFKHPTEADCTGETCILVPHRAPARSEYDVGGATIAVGAYRGAMIWLPTSKPPVPLVKPATRRRPVRSLPRPAVPPRSDLAAALSRMPEIRLVATRGTAPGVAEVYAEGGRAVITRDGTGHAATYTYHLAEAPDPLGYPVDLYDRHLDAREWLARTAELPFPDLPFQLVNFFDSERAPDLYLSPKDGIGFKDARVGGHGGLSRIESVVPLVFAGPGVGRGTRPYARSVDLAPTLLSYLSIPFDARELDGTDLGIVSKPLGPWPPLSPVDDESPDEE